MRKLVIIGALALSGCATLGSPGSAQAVYGLEGGYATALTAAVAYRQLPRCGGGDRVCHDPAVVARIIAADNRAHDALLSVEGLVRARGSAQQVAAGIALAQTAISDFAVATSAH